MEILTQPWKKLLRSAKSVRSTKRSKECQMAIKLRSVTLAQNFLVVKDNEWSSPEASSKRRPKYSCLTRLQVLWTLTQSNRSPTNLTKLWRAKPSSIAPIGYLASKMLLEYMFLKTAKYKNRAVIKSFTTIQSRFIDPCGVISCKNKIKSTKKPRKKIKKKMRHTSLKRQAIME